MELGELAFRALDSDGPNFWMAVVSDGKLDVLARALFDELSALQPEIVEIRSITSAFELEHLTQLDRKLIVLAGLDTLVDADWQRINVNRSRLYRSGTSLLVLDEPSIERLEKHAPDLASWLAGNIWSVKSPDSMDATMIAYDFEVYFPSGERLIPFIRFDLNSRGHSNDELGLRAHLHPGHEDLQLPSPLLSPLDALNFVIYRCRPRREALRS
jgi:hypothetical protein